MAGAFRNLDQHVTETGLSDVFAPGMAGLFVDTLQVTRLAGSARINSIAEVATAEVDIRLLPETDDEALLQRIREALGSQIQLEVLLRFPATSASPAGREPGSAFQVVREVLEAEGQGPVVPIFIAGFTDSRFFRHRGIAAYGLSPFTLEPQDLLGIHGRDERINLRQFDDGVRRMKRIISSLGTKVTVVP
jgi:carboxypeptidase PM20D1